MRPKFHEPFECEYEPLAPLDLDEVSFDDVRRLSVAILTTAFRDARTRPHAAISELRDGGWDLWLQIANIPATAALRHLEELASAVPNDPPITCSRRGEYFAGTSAPRQVHVPKTAPAGDWDRDRWIREIPVAGPQKENLAERAGLRWEACRAQLSACGLLRRHQRYEMLHDELEDQQAVHGLAAE